MKIAYFTKQAALLSDTRVASLLEDLRNGGCELYPVSGAQDLRPETDSLMAIGGDGTFLGASQLVAGTEVPVLGVNLGRLGFLSENKPEEVAGMLLNGDYSVESRTMLSAGFDGVSWMALNEVCVSRVGAGMLGVDVVLNGQPLPTYWADGLLVSTSSGSTAYSLSAGGPICTPQSRVLLIVPVAPHNLNVRPLVVPENSEIGISLKSRDSSVVVSADTRTRISDASVRISVRAVPGAVKILTLGRSSFIGALSAKLHWGEDFRNEK